MKRVKRSYNSTRRNEQAQETRLRVLRAAHDLFAANGYSRTTIAEIADRADVAVETVYAAFRNKATILRQAWYAMFRGDEKDLPLFERPEMQAILAEPDLVARTRKHAAFVTASNRRSAPLLHAIEGAAASEPDAVDMLAEWIERRLDVATKYASAAAATGRLAVSEEDCRDILFATMDGALWQRLVEQRGWSDERFSSWLSEFWLAALVKR